MKAIAFSDLEKEILLLFHERNGKSGMHRYLDKYPQFFRRAEGQNSFKRFAEMGLLEGLDKNSSIEDYRNTFIQLSPLGKAIAEAILEARKEKAEASED
ncbi:MAG: hypothetical protein CMO55_01445 [Verrucomicrobiales bacterium]|nr:hypothetical protein [Verrucomicrobiales bacterium]